jgi:hypothetical protein
MNKKAIVYDHYFADDWSRGVLSKQRQLRDNVILLGDLIEDAGMVDPEKHDTIVKVGFLNEPDDEKLEGFAQVYDVVVQQDGCMHAVNAILRTTCAG